MDRNGKHDHGRVTNDLSLAAKPEGHEPARHEGSGVVSQLMTIREAAAYLRLDEEAVRQAAWSDELPGVWHQDELWVDKPELQRRLESYAGEPGSVGDHDA